MIKKIYKAGMILLMLFSTSLSAQDNNDSIRYLSYDLLLIGPFYSVNSKQNNIRGGLNPEEIEDSNQFKHVVTDR
jgi:hypothetical protein